MELLCCEKQTEVQVMSVEDPALVDDDRVLHNLLAAETNCSVAVEPSSFERIQHEVTPEMRRILTTWMAEVCEDQCCEDVVFPLATVLLDRVLSLVRLKKAQLQLVGTVCLLISSKLRQCRSLGGELLCFYTDNSISLQELISWEMFALGKLRWDISAVTPTDFLTTLIARIRPCVGKSTASTIRQHAQIFISLCCTEFQFSLHKPSLVAVSSLCVAATGLRVDKTQLETMMTTMQQLTGHGAEEMAKCVMEIEALFSSRLTLMPSVHQSTAIIGNQKRTSATGNSCPPGSKSAAASALLPDDLSQQPETPTDVQDIHF